MWMRERDKEKKKKKTSYQESVNTNYIPVNIIFAHWWDKQNVCIYSFGLSVTHTLIVANYK